MAISNRFVSLPEGIYSDHYPNLPLTWQISTVMTLNYTIGVDLPNLGSATHLPSDLKMRVTNGGFLKRIEMLIGVFTTNFKPSILG